MLCAKMATRRDGFKFPCGKCVNCRINQRRSWVARLLLEAACNEYSAFITLTFADTGTPHFVRRSDLKYFYRNLRNDFPTLRHFSVGEYGTRTGRAHYHAHIFTPNRPIHLSAYQKAWPFGHIHVGDTQADSIQYVFGYLFKNPALRWPIEVRYPEFRSFSQGIGRGAFDELSTAGYLPREFSVLGQRWPIPRYFRNLARSCGLLIDDTQTTKLENLEVQYVRSLLQDSTLSSSQVADVYDEAQKRRVAKSQELQRKAIRDAYKQTHGHVKKGNANETF